MDEREQLKIYGYLRVAERTYILAKQTFVDKDAHVHWFLVTTSEFECDVFQTGKGDWETVHPKPFDLCVVGDFIIEKRNLNKEILVQK